MADLKHLKVQPHGENGDNDPLAELTRIMGLAPQSGSNAGGSDDFGIDLERELIGELGANDSRAPVPVVPTPNVAPVVDAPSRTIASKSIESWKSAFGEVAAGPRQAETDRSRATGDPVPSMPAAPQPRETLVSRPAAPAVEPPTVRRDWSVPRAPEPIAPVAPAPRVQSPEKLEEDPFERLAAFSRQWLDRSQPDARPAGDVGEAGSNFRMPDRPAGPASPFPAAERPRPAMDDSPRPAVAPSSALSSPATPSTAPQSSARDRLFAAASGQSPSAAPRGVIDPEPVAAPAASDKIFDPFAELVAMAGQSRPAPASPTAASVAPSVTLRPSPAPVAGGSAEAGAHNQSSVANPSIIARRTNWQSVSGGAPAVAPREAPPRVTPVAAAPIAATFAPAEDEARIEPVGAEPVMSAAVSLDAPEPVAATADVSAAPRDDARAFAIVPDEAAEPVAQDDVAGDPTWDAISDWVARPSGRMPQPVQVEERAPDDVEDDYFLPRDAEDDPVLPPVARIPELAPVEPEPASDAVDHDDFGGFGDDFDLEALLRSELEDEGLRASGPRFDDDVVGSVLAVAPALPVDEPTVRPVLPAAIDDRTPASQAMPAHDSAPAAVLEPEEPVNGGDDSGMPDVDTVEVPTAHYLVADEIDVPELVVEEDVQPSIAQDDIDADFGGGFEDRADTRPAAGIAGTAAAAATTGEAWSMPTSKPAAPVRDVDDLDAAFDEAVRSWAEAESEKDAGRDDAADAALWRNVRSEPADLADDDGFDPEYQPVPAPSYQSQPVHRSRGLVVAAVVAGVAVLGGIGAFVMSLGGDGSGDAPTLVRADQEPVKVKPEQPGGATVPNQDKAVYERFSSGETANQPSQERLVSTEEEPVNLAVRTVPITAPTPLIDPADADSAEELPGAFGQPSDTAVPKSEDRVEPLDDIDAALSEDVAVIAPRRVRTMVVRPDGTLVPREEIEPEAVVAAAEPAPLAEAPIRTSEAVPAPASAQTAANTAPVAESAAEPASTPVAPVQEPPVRAVESQTITREQATPTRGPVAPARPSDQPVEIIGNAGGAAAGTQVAAAQPAPVVAAQSSEWAMQIASQPSPEGAQASYADLSRRYGSVLNGRGVNIVKAEIAGKGTYWRVRIPAGSRAEANALCERYKAAGGSCFVSR